MSINPEPTVVGADHRRRWLADKFVAATARGLFAIVDDMLDYLPAVARKRGVDTCQDYPGGIPLVDAMSLVVPTGLHYKIAREFLKAGIRFPVKMPITQTALQG